MSLRSMYYHCEWHYDKHDWSYDSGARDISDYLKDGRLVVVDYGSLNDKLLNIDGHVIQTTATVLGEQINLYECEFTLEYWNGSLFIHIKQLQGGNDNDNN